VIPTGKIRFFRMIGAVYKSRDALSPAAAAFIGMLARKPR